MCVCVCVLWRVAVSCYVIILLYIIFIIGLDIVVYCICNIYTYCRRNTTAHMEASGMFKIYDFTSSLCTDWRPAIGSVPLLCLWYAYVILCIAMISMAVSSNILLHLEWLHSSLTDMFSHRVSVSVFSVKSTSSSFTVWKQCKESSIMTST